MVVAGIDMSDVLRIRAQKPDWSDWPALWEKLGDEHLKRGDDSLAAGHTVTAGQAYRMAALSYHYGHFMLFDRPQLKERLMRKAWLCWTRDFPIRDFQGNGCTCNVSSGKFRSYSLNIRIPRGEFYF